MVNDYERLQGSDWQSLTTPENYHREVVKLRAEIEELKAIIECYQEAVQEAVKIYDLSKKGGNYEKMD